MKTALKKWEQKIKEIEKRKRELVREKERVKRLCIRIINDCSEKDIDNLVKGFFPIWISVELSHLDNVEYYDVVRALRILAKMKKANKI